MSPLVQCRPGTWAALLAGVIIPCVWGHAAAESGAERLRFFEERVKADAQDFIAWNGLGDLCLLRQRETGDDAWLGRAAQAAEASVQAVGPAFNPGGLALAARVALAMHRFAEARDRARQL